MKAIIIGAGKVGRGLIAGVCRMNGIEYCMVETNWKLIRTFHEQKNYFLHIIGKREQKIQMQTVPVFHVSEKEVIERQLLTADLIFTAVGGQNLREVGEFLGRCLNSVLIHRSWSGALNIIAHENWKYKDNSLGDNILKELNEENQEIFREMVGVSNALTMGLSVSPNTDDREVSPLDIWMQDQWNIFVNKAGYKGDLPKIKGIGFVDQFRQLQSQALYTNNASSAVISYIGKQKGYIYVADAARDPEIEQLLDMAYQEIETALVKELHVFPQDQKELAMRAREKYRDKNIRDTIERHARDPIRKLGPEERLLAPACMAMRSGVRPEALACGIAAALYYEDENDPSAVQLAVLRREKGPEAVLSEICGLESSDALFQLILEKIDQVVTL